ncbi:MAG: DUF418 domain-containing protein [Planctomycetes bacterium]|nr:DUF418 domain-containing protein [Planctomycetota bacterium]
MVDEVQSVPPTEPTADLPSMVVGESLKPVAATERIYTLDVLRGFAIFGIFMVNIAFFAMPLANAIGQRAGEESTIDLAVHSVVKAFFEFKFVSTFSLLFGMGLVIQMNRAAKRNRPFVGLYLRRTFLLMAMGAIHGLLLWYGDILFIYSFVALLVVIIVLLMREIRPKVMLWFATGALVLSVLEGSTVNFLSVFFTGMSAPSAQSVESTVDGDSLNEESDNTITTDTDSLDFTDDSQVSVPESTEDLNAESAVEHDTEPIDEMDRFYDVLLPGLKGNDPNDWDRAEVIAYKEGPMLATLIMRAITFGGMLVFAGLLGGFGLRVLAMFLFGVALMKLNFFDQKHKRWHVRLCVFGTIIGVLGELSVIAILYLTEHKINYGWAAAESLHQITSFFLCFGYIGAITLLVQAGLLRWLTYAMSCVGRTALSNYLLQTIVATYIMYWWGLGMFNDVSRPQQMAIVVGVYCCQLVLSVLYLQVFSIGPFEWLWRSLTYLKFQPILRRASTTTP